MYCNTLGFLSFTLQKQVIACNILLINMLNKFIYAVQKKVYFAYVENLYLVISVN